MRCNGFVISIAVAGTLALAPHPTAAATFGSAIAIGGQASDIALDESRGVLYIANFTANRIEVMSTANRSIRTSMNVSAQPSALAISQDSNYLLVAHYGNYTTADSTKNLVTLINLNDSTRQTFTTGDPPLGVAFLKSGLAVIVTTTSFMTFDPSSGVMQVIATFSDLSANQLPLALATIPSQATAATLAVSGDGLTVFGLALGTSGQVFLRFNLNTGLLTAIGFTASPVPLPRLAVAYDGSWAMFDHYRFDKEANDTAQFPNVVTSTTIGGVAVNSTSSTIYAQFPTATSGTTPYLTIMDADNLTVQDTLYLPENIVGRAVLKSDDSVMYAVSDSGVLVLPVGSLKQYSRLTPLVSDLSFSFNSCQSSVISQYLTVWDPGGGNTAFTVTSATTGVTVSPSSGTTPATVKVLVDPTAFQGVNGTSAVTLTVSSAAAINVPQTVRVLVNNRNPNQRGTVINVPGTLSDIQADPSRSRFYVLRQDKNQVLVYDSSTYALIRTLRTSTTPTQMAITFDGQYLVIGHENSQQAWVYDLDTYDQEIPIQFPAGHYPRSLAASGAGMLALARDVSSDGGLPGTIDRVSVSAGSATRLSNLGTFTNSLSATGVMAGSSNGAYILVAAPDGNVLLYNASSNTFTVSRKDVTSLSGAFAASSYGSFAVANYLLNASLVPATTLSTSSGTTTGFAFVDDWGFRTMASTASNPGTIERVYPATGSSSSVAMAEAPLLPTTSQPLMRTLAPLSDRSAVISLSTSGFTVLSWSYDAAVSTPKITSVVSAADGSSSLAPGGLISVYGSNMSPTNIATSEIPLPTALGDSCLAVNGVAMPLLFVSSGQINGQLPYTISGSATMQVRTPGGVSDNFYLSVSSAAPTVFRSGTAGTDTGLATVVRSDNNQLVTPTNPIHPGNVIVIYATGLGLTSPSVDAGLAAPSSPLASATIQPTVTLGGVALKVEYAGLTPGEAGVYQINATVPSGVPQGLSIPLTITQGGSSTSLSVRVVN